MDKKEIAVVKAALRWGRQMGLSKLSPAEAKRLVRYPVDKALAGPVAALLQSKQRK